MGQSILLNKNQIRILTTYERKTSHEVVMYLS